MLNIQSKIRHESKAVPGVAFTVRTLNKIQRAKRDLPIAEHVIAYTEAMEEFNSLDGAESGNRRRDLAYRAGLITDQHIKPAVIAAGLVSIEGLEIDGSPATAESLLASASPECDELIEEIYYACDAASGLTADQQKNSQSPTTSTGPVAGEEITSSAESAGV